MPERDPFRLTLKLDGPLVREHRLPLSELQRVTRYLRTALLDVAIVLTEQGPSGQSGRTKKVLEDATDLQVVATPRPGSFVLELEAPPEPTPEQETLGIGGPHLAEQCVAAFVAGLDALTEDAEELPKGFDRGVLKAVTPFRAALKKGLTEIVLSVDARSQRLTSARIDSEKVEIARRLIKKPVRAHVAVEGMLQMVDFGALECRIDRPPLPSVTCFFNERDRDAVHQAVRQFVRVAGEGEFEPGSNEPKRLWASSVTLLYEALPFDSAGFWHERDVAELAEEQRVSVYELPSDEDDDWRDNDAAAELIAAIHDHS